MKALRAAATGTPACTAIFLFLFLALPVLLFAQEDKAVAETVPDPLGLGIGFIDPRGYSPETGVLEDPSSAPIRWTGRNFLGSHQTFVIAAGASLRRQTVSMSYSDPSIAGSRWSAGVAFLFDHQAHQDVLQDFVGPVFQDSQFASAAPDPYASRSDWLADIQAGNAIPSQYLMTYQSWDLGIGLTFDYHVLWGSARLGVKGGIRSGVRYVGYDPTLNRPYDLVLRQNENKWALIDRLYPTFYFDSRDSVLNTARGFLVSQGVEYTGGLLFGDRHSIRTDSVLEGYLPIVNVPLTTSTEVLLVLAVHTGFSAILPQFAYWSPVNGVPPAWGWYGPVAESSDLLYPDGVDSARGWDPRVGTYGSQARWDNKLELRLQVVRRFLWVVGFMDATGLWNTPGDVFPLRSDAFVFSFGAGLRLTTPLVPLRVYYVRGIQTHAGAEDWNAQSLVLSFGGDVF